MEKSTEYGENFHDELFDIEMVEEYLKRTNGKPCLESMKEFKSDKYQYFDWKDFLLRDWHYKLEIFRRAGCVEIDGIASIEIKDMRVEFVNEPVELEPLIVWGMSQNGIDAINVRFECKTCGHQFVYPNEMTSEERKYKMDCGCSNPKYSEVMDKRDLIDVQWVKLQEIKRNRNLSRLPMSINARMKGEKMMWSLSLNERIRPIGFIKYSTVKDRETGRKRRIPWFEMYGYKRVKREEYDIILSESDIEYIKSEMAKPGFFKRLLASFCPHIAGMEDIKELALLTLASVRMKRPLRLLVVGDPSTGKSQIEQYANNILPDSYYVVMSDARKTGLTITSQKDPETNTWTVEQGVFAAADNSALFVDELNQSKAEDISALNHVIESGRINYALAGGQYGEFSANCAIMICANAYGGLIGSEQNIHEILKFVGRGLPAFLARMNLVLLVRDEKSPSEETRVAETIYANSEVSGENRYDKDWFDGAILEELEEEIVPGLSATALRPATRFGLQTIRKIIKYVVEYVKLEGMPEELREPFVDYYMKKRSDVVERVNKLVNIRFMRHSIVLAQVFARVQGRSKPIESDMLHIFSLLEKHMSLAAYDPKTNEIDANMLNGLLSKREQKAMDDQSEVREAIEKYMAEKDPDGNRIHKFFTVEGISEKLWYSDPVKWNDAETKVRRIVRTFLHTNMIYEKGAPGSGEYGLS